MSNTHYYRNNAANYIYKSAISSSSSSPHGGCSVLSTYYYRNNPANYIYKSAISSSSSSPHGSCSILNTYYYYYRNNPPNYIYKSAISPSSSSPHGSCSMFVRPDPRQFPQAGEHSMLCFLHVHRRVLQSVMQLHLITRSRFSGAGPKHIFFFGGSKLLLPGARPGSKTNFLVAKLDVHFLRNENILILYIFPQQSCRGHLRLCS